MKGARKQFPLKKEFMEKIIEFVPEAILCLDEKGKIVFSNNLARELLWEGEALLNQQNFFELLQNTSDKEQFLRIVDDLKKGKLGEKTETAVFQLRPGLKKEFNAQFKFSTFEAEKKFYLILVIRPANLDGEEIVNQLRDQHLAALGRLADNLARDFNNIITMIQGYAELMNYQIKERDPFFKQVEAILKATQYAEKLTSQLLTFGSPQQTAKQNVDLSKVYFKIKDLITALINDQIELREEIDQPLWVIKGEPQKLQKVFLNLIINALEAMPDGGQLTIKIKNQKLSLQEKVKIGLTSGTQNFVLLQISDTGKGMPEDAQKRVFEPYFSADNDKQKKGLGLSEVYGIVKAMRGVIQLGSELGKGTTFTIYFPAVEILNKTEETAKMETKGGQETILVVEDVPEVQLLLVELLQTVGYRVIGKSNFQEAMDYYEKHAEEIDMIISDVVLPDNYGTELISEILKERPNLKYLLISGYAEQLDIEQNQSLFKGHFLQKPFQPAVLLNMVREMLDKE